MKVFHRAMMLVAGVALTGSVAATPIGISTHRLDLILKPVRDQTGNVEAIQVRLGINGAMSESGKPLSLAAPVMYPGAMRVADRIQNLEAHDARGNVPLKVEEDKPVPGGFPYYRHWVAQRPVKFPVSVTYAALVQPEGGPNGPAFGIRPSAQGVSGSGGGFLLLPENAGTTLSRVTWDLSDLPSGSIGVTSFGEGAFEVPGAPDKLNEEWMMAGPANRYTPPSNIPFNAFWLGNPPFDMKTEMAWAARAYGYLGQSFGYLNPVPNYRVFVRVLNTPPFGSGTALNHSFMLSMGPKGPVLDDTTTKRRLTFFHEMTHQWVGAMDGPNGVIAWYVEGLTVYSTTVLPLRGDLVSVNDYGDLLNLQARQYYESAARNWSAKKIADVGFSDESTRETPYVRGALYFAALDAKIRRASHNKRDLDVFLRPMFESRQNGAPFNQQVWESMLLKELGPKEVSDFRAELIDGTKLVVPDPGAFGPCFRRKDAELKSKDGKAVNGYQWERVASIPDDKCRTW